MIDYTLDTANAILYVRPMSALKEDDLKQLAETVDPYIIENDKLAGIIIEAAQFPGWDNFAAIISHFRFVQEHHRQVKKVGLVTDSALANVAENLASHFVSAEIRHFPAGELAAAKRWIMNEQIN